MSSPARSARRLQRKKDGSLELAEVQLPAVDAVPGLEAGFLLGSTAYLDNQWDVILHPTVNEYSVRQHDCDETSGLIIRVPKNNAAKIIMDGGFLFSKKMPLPKNAEDGKVLLAQHGQLTYLMSLQDFVVGVLAMANVIPDDKDDD